MALTIFCHSLQMPSACSTISTDIMYFGRLYSTSESQALCKEKQEIGYSKEPSQ